MKFMYPAAFAPKSFLHGIILLVSLTMAFPFQGKAVFFTQARGGGITENSGVSKISTTGELQDRRYKYRSRHSRHFGGRHARFWGIFALALSILGAVSLVAGVAVWIAIAFFPPLIYLGGTLSLAGCITGMLQDSTTGTGAAILGLVSGLAFLLIVGIYGSTLGSYAGILQFIFIFVPH